MRSWAWRWLGALLCVGAMAFSAFGQGTRAFEIGAGRTGEKPQSKVWFYDNAWWCVLPGIASGHMAHRIHRFDGVSWASAGDASDEIDVRVDARADVLCEDDALFVLSFHPDGSLFDAFDYDPAHLRYVRRGGFPVRLDLSGLSGVETVAFTRDGEGRFWAAFEGEAEGRARGEVRVIWSKDDTGRRWDAEGTRLGVGLDADDIAAICRFTVGEVSHIGVVWSRQSAQKSSHRDSAGVNRLWMRLHRDGTSARAWSPPERIASGVALTDDHLNLAVARDGTVYLATKTSLDDLKPRDPALPLLKLYVRSPGGQWAGYPISPIRERGTRPIVVLDDEREMLHVFYSRPAGENGRDRQIVHRRSSRSPISFNDPQVAIAAPGMYFNDPTSTHQRLTSESGLLMMCWGKKDGRHGRADAYYRIYLLEGG